MNEQRTGFRFCLNRRSVLMALTGSVAMLTIPIRAQQNSDGGSLMYFVPGGRIGFMKPDEIGVWSNRWIFLSQDHTLMVQVRETLRLGPQDDSYMWDKDSRSQRIETSLALDGFDVRRFRDLSYDPSPDYADESVVLRDAHWMGEVQVSNGSQGGLANYLGGQNARWRGTMGDILSSIVVRPQPAIADALGELRVSLDTTGLNPRLVGEQLILSLYTPRNASEAWGANLAVIRTNGLTLVPPGTSSAERAQFIDEQFSILKQTPGSRELVSASGRGILLEERQIVPGQFATTLHAFGRTRQLEFTAFYSGENRGPLIDALHRVFQSLTIFGVVL